MTIAPVDRFELNRMCHARAQELKLPNSPAGKSGHPNLSQCAKDVFGVDSWSKLEAAQMRQIFDFMDQHERLPSSLAEVTHA